MVIGFCLEDLLKISTYKETSTWLGVKNKVLQLCMLWGSLEDLTGVTLSHCHAPPVKKSVGSAICP